MTKKRICARKGCTTEILEDDVPNKRYCSGKCRRAVEYAERQSGPTKRERVPCAREGCKRTLPEVRPANQKYCSPLCKKQVQQGREVKPALAERECAYCGQIFPPKSETNVYCDPRCAEAASNAARRQLRYEQGLFAIKEAPLVAVLTDVQEGERAFYIGDLHYPFQEKGLWLAVQRALIDYQPDKIFYCGDMLDAYTISVFLKNPTRFFDMEKEFSGTRHMLDYHRQAVPNAEQIWLDGNHEFRLQRYLWNRGPELVNLRNEDGNQMLSIDSILGLRKRGIMYMPFPGRIDYAGFIVTHGPFRMNANIKHAAKWMGEKVRSSGLCCHFHRNQGYSWRGDKGQSQSWTVMGCLCGLDPDYDPFADWQYGFAYSQVIEGAVHPTSVQPFGGRFQVEGVTYEYSTEEEEEDERV